MRLAKTCRCVNSARSVRNERSALTSLLEDRYGRAEIPKDEAATTVHPLTPESTADLAKLLAALRAVRDGDFSVQLPGDWTGLAGKIADTFNEIVASNRTLASELARFGDAVGRRGGTRQRLAADRRGGAWGEMEGSVNTLSNLQAEKTRELERLNESLAAANSELAATNTALQDEVERREAAQFALQEADHRKDEFLAMLSHELRNPLAAIGSAVQIMQHKNLFDPQLGWARDVLGRQVDQLNRLIDDLLDIARISRGKITLRKEPVDLLAVISRAVESARPAIDARHHDLRVQLPDRPIRLHGDPVRLTQVVSNLLTNAAKYSDDGGRIELVASHVAGHGPGGIDEVELTVRDSGAGIAPEELATVFDLFRQLDNPLTRKEGGLGVGLALARGLVEMHEGHIEARSEGVGRGSEFTLRLPQLLNEAMATESEHAASGAQRITRLRLLLVDDNVDSARTLAMLLELSGHEVQVAHSGAAALDKVDRYRPDCIFLDIGMPDMNGYEVARRLRGAPKLNGTYLVALTGYGREYDRQQAEAAGFDQYLIKPVDFERLQQLLEEFATARSSPRPTAEAKLQVS